MVVGGAVPGQIARVLCAERVNLQLFAAVRVLDPRFAHVPVELQIVALELGDLVDQAAEVVQPHPRHDEVPHVQAAVFQRRLHSQACRRQFEVRPLLWNNVAGQLKGDAQPLQKLVGGIHRRGFVVAPGHNGRLPRQINRLDNEAVLLQPGELYKLFPLGRRAEWIVLRAAQNDQRCAGGRRVALDNGKFGPGQLPQIALNFLGHPTIERPALAANDNRRFRLPILDQETVLRRRGVSE